MTSDGRRKCILALGLILLATGCTALSSLSLSNREMSNANNVAAMLAVDECNAPCLFGTSLRKATFKDIRALLTKSVGTYGAAFEFDPNYISWRWSERAVQSLISGGFRGLSMWRDVNYAYFQNGLLSSIHVSFALSLEDVISEFGDDFVVYPLANYGRFTTYALVYPQFGGGVFEAFMPNCHEPQLTPHSLIMGFYYRSHLEDEIALADTTPWQGFATQLPDCSAFKPPG